jgi:hypothetical protein
LKSAANRQRRDGCTASKGGRPARIGDLKAHMTVDYTTPGSALDDQLRHEQARAVFALLADSAKGANNDR